MLLSALLLARALPSGALPGRLPAACCLLGITGVVLRRRFRRYMLWLFPWLAVRGSWHWDPAPLVAAGAPLVFIACMHVCVSGDRAEWKDVEENGAEQHAALSAGRKERCAQGPENRMLPEIECGRRRHTVAEMTLAEACLRVPLCFVGACQL